MPPPQAPPVGVQPGSILAGKYRVERVIGVGGMGVVVVAHHLQLDEKVALKFLLPHALENADAVSRFLREARAAVKIKSEHVARVIDVGELESGSPYIVMEYLEGIDLSAWIAERGVFPVQLGVDFLLQTCVAIADAHALGIVHRDLKPANLFCVQRTDGQPSIKVLDFGISKLTAPGHAAQEMTRTSTIVGSPYYMSPEQMQSAKRVDARSDIWSLGVILYEMLVGQPPFAAQSVMELAVQIATAPLRPVAAFRNDVPKALEQVIATCLEKDRARRFQTVGELAAALGPFGSLEGRASVLRVQGTLRQAGIGPPAQALASEPADGESPVGALRVSSASSARSADRSLPAASGPGGAPVAASTGPSSPTAAPWSRTGGAPTPPRLRPLLVVGGALIGVTILGIVGARKAHETAPQPSPAPVSASPTAASPLHEGTPARAEGRPEPGTLSDGHDAGAASVRAPDASSGRHSPSNRPPPRPKASAGSPADPQRPNPAEPDCTTLYYFDSKGNHVFKPECVK